jgi:Cft2 family RNA processing exonuclease
MTWDDLDIIVDSPLAADFTAGYAQLRDHWDAEARRKVAAGRHPLAFEQLTTIDDHATHLRTVDYLARTARPAIVIAASGMCSGGRIVNYLKAMLGDPRHDVLFTGYQASGTPGRDIQKYGPKGGYVDLDGQRYPIRAGIHTLGGYSAHADQKDLLNFIGRMRRQAAPGPPGAWRRRRQAGPRGRAQATTPGDRRPRALRHATHRGCTPPGRLNSGSEGRGGRRRVGEPSNARPSRHFVLCAPPGACKDPFDRPLRGAV